VLKGISSELSSLKDKTRNRFVLDTQWFNEEEWRSYQQRADVIRASNSVIVLNFWEWAREQEWPAYALPEEFVGESTPYTQHLVQSAIFQRKPKKYSLLATSEAYCDYLDGSGNWICQTIEKSEIDFRPFANFEIPYEWKDNRLMFSMDCEGISKLANMDDPMRVVLDYVYRTGKSPRSILLRDVRAESAGDFINSVAGENVAVDGIASWWTKVPLPIRKEWYPVLHRIPTKYHESLIVELNDHPEIWNDISCMSQEARLDEIESHFDEHVEEWIKAIHTPASAVDKVQAFNPHASGDPRKEIPLNTMNFIGAPYLEKVLNDIFGSKLPDDDMDREVEYKPVIHQALSYDRPSWMDEACSDVSEYEWNPDASGGESDDEAALLAEIMDRGLNDDPFEPDGEG
jgi:hypothetical protein